MHQRRPELKGLAVLSTSVLSACVATGGAGTSAADAGSATLANYGSIMRPRCEDADMKVINGNREAVCRAYLESLDGKPVGGGNQSLIALGAHRFTIHCNYAIIGPNDHGAVPQTRTAVVYEGDLSAPGKYYIRAEMVADACKVWISDTPPEPPAPLWKAFMP